MCFNIPSADCSMQPMFVKQMKGAGEGYGVKQGYVNIQDIANLKQIEKNYREADSMAGIKNPDGTTTVYHFDDKGAQQILNYMA